MAPSALTLKFAVGFSLLLSALSATAAVPSNDDCSGAEIIPAAGPFPALTSVVSDISDATSTADPPAPSCQAQVSRSIWYTFTPAMSGRYLFSTCADAPTGTTVADTVMAVYTSATGCNGPFTEVSQGGCDDDGCGFEANQSSVGVALTAGTVYYVLVYKYSTSPPSSGATAVQLRVSTFSAPANDICSAATDLTLNIPATGSTALATNDYELPSNAACFMGLNQTKVTAVGRDVVYKYTPSASGNYSFRVKGSGVAVDSALYVSTTCPSGAAPAAVNACVAASNRSTLSGEEVSCMALTSGVSYYAFVDTVAASAGSPFELEVSACLPEVETNNTIGQANAFACGTSGSIGVAGDVDFYSLGSASGRIFAMLDGYTGSESDFDLRVTSATHTIEYDDNDADNQFGDNAPVIAGARVNGPTYLRVSHYISSQAQEPYRLYAVVQPDSAHATLEVEPNEVPAQATAAANLYFAGTLSGAAPSTDHDVYRVTANAGDLLFVSLDGDPTRDSTPLNARIELLNGNGDLLLGVNDYEIVSSNVDAGPGLNNTVPTSPGEAFTYRVPVGGTFYVRVSTAGGVGAETAGDYLLSISKNCVAGGPTGPAPTLTSLSPTSGPAAGGNTVTLTGTQFISGATVSFGSSLATNVVFNSATSLTATVPSHAPGAVDVTVRNPDSQGATLTGGYTYTAQAPTVTMVAPTSGPSSGGTAVVVTGTNFYPGATVRFGTTPASVVVVSSQTRLTATTPVHAGGPVDVVVINTDMQQGSLASAFTFLAEAPTLASVSPAMGSTLGGTAVTLTGTGFQTGATVTFGGTAGTHVNVVSATSITVSTPAHGAGAVMVEVKNPDNQVGQKNFGFTFVAPPAPTVMSVTPNTGPTSGGDRVIVTGTGFAPGALLSLGGALATQINVVSETFIEALTPAHAAGMVNVVVTNPDGQAGALMNGYTYVGKPAPKLSVVVPVSGPTQGGTVVTLTGSFFENGATVSFGGQPCTSVNVKSVNTITCETPAHAAGSVTVQVTNPDAQVATLLNGFTYEGPVVDAGLPDAGKPDAGKVDSGQPMLEMDSGVAPFDGGYTRVEVRQGCGCSTSGATAAGLWLVLGLLWRLRRRHAM